jgi:molecular chaperone DnaK (HSP70)
VLEFADDESGELRDCSAFTMITIAEHLKRRLSSAADATFKCRAEGGGALAVTVSRADFERVCDPVFARAVQPLDRVLESHGMTSKEIDEVVLVGGTTRIPRIRDLLRQHLNISHLNTHIDPDVTVAVGAACVVD